MNEKLSRRKKAPMIGKLAIHRKQRFLHYVMPCKIKLRVNQKLLPDASNDAIYYTAIQNEVTYAI